MAKTSANKSSVDTATKTMDAMAAANKETVEKFVTASNEAVTKGFGKAFSSSKEQADTMTKNYEQVASFGKENAEAVVEASNIALKGVEAINNEIMAFAKTSMADSMTAFSKLMAVKTPQEALELQGEMVKSSFETMVAKTTEISEMGNKLANEAAAPVSARANVAMETFSKPFAA